MCEEGVRLGQEGVKWCQEVFGKVSTGVRKVIDGVKEGNQTVLMAAAPKNSTITQMTSCEKKMSDKPKAFHGLSYFWVQQLKKIKRRAVWDKQCKSRRSCLENFALGMSQGNKL